jgi:colicin import membrane protein
MTTQQPLALATTETVETVKITRYDALLADIKIAQDSAVKSFAYNRPKGQQDAKTYIKDLKSLCKRIEAARVEEKAYSLEYGRSVDSQAKALKRLVEDLITPHQEALDTLATAEAERVARHKARLDTIAEWVRAGEAPGVAADAIRQCITWLQECPTDDMEEFQHEAEQVIDRALSILPALESAAKEREEAEAAAAAEALRVAEEERLQREAEAEERGRKQAEAAAAEAAAAAARAVAEAEAETRRVQERADAAERQRQADEEARAAADARRAADEQARQQREQEAQDRAARAQAERRDALAQQLADALTGKTKAQVVEALLAGTFHPAVAIDWARV